MAQNDAEQRATILKLIIDADREISRSEILAALQVHQGEAAPSAATLKRRISELVESGQIERIGKGRGVKYLVPPGLRGKAAMQLTAKAQATAYVPMSEQGRDVRDYVRRPVQERIPIGYQQDFLESYEPNRTDYLSADLKQHLHSIGQTPRQSQVAGTFAQDVLNRLIIDLSWASSKLEGNTYTRLDTQNLIEAGQFQEGKDRAEATMILNHKRAIEMLVEQAAETGFNRYTFCNLHAILSDGLLGDPNDSGRLRMRIVDISGTVYRPLSFPQQLERCFDLILEKTRAIQDPFEQAFFLMVHIPYLQPFVDVNKRVSRLGANISLLKHNLCPMSFLEVPETAYVEGTLGIYELNNVNLLKDVFIWAYERSCQQYNAIQQTVTEPDPFRLKYRQQLYAVVEKIVKRELANNPEEILASIPGQVTDDDSDAFIKLLTEELGNLHEGNLSRYRLRITDFDGWKCSS